MDNFNLFCIIHPDYNARCLKGEKPTATCSVCCRMFASHIKRNMEKVNVKATN